MTIKITDRYLKYGGHTYFRISAVDVDLGSWGRRKTPLGRTGYLDVGGRIHPGHLADEPIRVNKVNVDWDRVNETDIGGDAWLTYQGAGLGVRHTFSLRRAREAQVRLVSFTLAESPLERVLNREADLVRRQLEDAGDDARIVSKIWVAMEARLADDLNVTTLTNGDLDCSGASLRINVGTGPRNRSVMTLGPGTTFAYRLSRIRSWSGDRTQVRELELDDAG